MRRIRLLRIRLLRHPDSSKFKPLSFQNYTTYQNQTFHHKNLEVLALKWGVN